MLKKGYCSTCKSRSTCTVPCKEVEQDLRNFTSPGREIPISTLSDKLLDDHNIINTYNTNTYGDKITQLLLDGKISDAQHKIMWMRLVDGLTQKEIARQLCITQQNVSKVLQSLRNVDKYE